jgi:pyruvate/2-oxoglutarate dehydrogenase complex dihydrolipoamide acyltransferase (E2) component
MSTEVKVPNIGDFAEVEVIEVMVKVGDTIKVDQSLITVESDKASMEVPSSHAGVVKEVKVKVGDKVKEGSLLLVVEAGAVRPPRQPAAAAPAPAAARLPAPAPHHAPIAAPAGSSYSRPGRHRLRHDGAGRRSWRLLRRVPRRRPGPEHRARRALRDPGRRVPERRLHPVESAAARGAR